MIIYQPWIEIGGCDGEYATHSLSYHRLKAFAFKELDEKLNEWSKDNRIVIIKKGVNEIEVIE